MDVPVLSYDQKSDYYFTLSGYQTAARRSLAGFAMGGKVYAVGGRNDATPLVHASNEEYDPITDAWTFRTALTLGARYSGAGVSVNGGGAYIGGRDSLGTAQTGAAYYVRDSWSSLGSLGAARAEVDNQGVGI